ncbi:MAG: hypothetical protein WCG55_03975 [bacterium]
MKIVERDRAISLRKKGLTINEIVAETGYSKASVSVWVRNIPLTEKQKNRISEKGRSLASIELRRTSRLANERKKKEIVRDSAKNEIRGFSHRDLLVAGAMLYLGEGTKKSKGRASITNADPEVIQMAVRFLVDICGVPHGRLYGHIHIHSHLDIKRAEMYWSKVSGIPRAQFYKTYCKKSVASLNKKDSLPYGTIEVGTNDIKIFLKIMGWIEKIKELAIGAKIS